MSYRPRRLYRLRGRQRCRHRLQGRWRTGNAAVSSAASSFGVALVIAGLDWLPDGQIRSPLDCRAVAPRLAATGRADAPSHGLPVDFGISEIVLDGGVEAALLIRPSRPTQRGGSRSSRTRGGMRWTQAALKTRALACGRRKRVVLTPRRWRQVRAEERGRRWQESPVAGESTK